MARYRDGRTPRLRVRETASRPNRSRPRRAATSGDSLPSSSTASTHAALASVTPSTHSMTIAGAPSTCAKPNSLEKPSNPDRERGLFVLRAERRARKLAARGVRGVVFGLRPLGHDERLERTGLPHRVGRRATAPRPPRHVVESSTNRAENRRRYDARSPDSMRNGSSNSSRHTRRASRGKPSAAAAIDAPSPDRGSSACCPDSSLTAKTFRKPVGIPPVGG